MSEEHPQSPDPGPDTSAGGTAPSGGGIAPEVSRRVSSILDAVEGEAARLREDAREEARRYLDYSRRRADALVAERQRRISELSDDIMAKAEAVVGRLDDAAPVREGFENLVRALGDAAERLSREAERTRPEWEPPAFHDEAVAEHTPPPAGAPPAGGETEIPPGAPAPEAPPAVAGSGTTDPGWGASGAGYEAPAGAVPPEPGLQPPPHAAPAGSRPPEQGEPGSPAAGQPDPTPPPQPTQPAPAVPQPPAQHASAAAHGGAVDDAKLIAIQMAASGRTRHEVREHLHSVMGVTDTKQLLDEIFGADSAEDARVPWTAFPR